MAGVVLGDIDFYSGVARRGTYGTHNLLTHNLHTHTHTTYSPGGALGFRRGAGDAAAVGVAAVALGDIHLGFTWQAWHFVTSTFTLCGRRGTYGTGLALVARLVLGVAPGTPRRLAWQPWHLEASTLVSRGRRGTS